MCPSSPAAGEPVAVTGSRLLGNAVRLAWRFEPATLHGEPVAFDYRLTVNFDLKDAEATRCRQLRQGSP